MEPFPQPDWYRGITMKDILAKHSRLDFLSKFDYFIRFFHLIQVGIDRLALDVMEPFPLPDWYQAIIIKDIFAEHSRLDFLSQFDYFT